MLSRLELDLENVNVNVNLHELTGKKTPGDLPVHSGPAAVESTAASVVALTCWVCVVGTGFGWL